MVNYSNKLHFIAFNISYYFNLFKTKKQKIKYFEYFYDKNHFEAYLFIQKL